MVKYERTLFKVHSSGQVGDWKIHVSANDDGTACITRESTKVIGGKAVVTATLVREGKNVGRSNETSAIQQAIKDASSKVCKQLDKGYVVEPPKVGEKATNRLNLPKPMLAYPKDKIKNFGELPKPYFVQPKLDGHRMLATVLPSGELVMYSRGGKPIDVPHIKHYLQGLYKSGLWDGTVLDGELYAHGKTLQEISRLVKKHRPETAELRYFVYDIVDEVRPYEQRHLKLMEILGPETNVVQLLEVVELSEMTHVESIHSINLREGYEGSIVRLNQSGYEDGKRSKQLIKMKDFVDDEFEIVSWSEGKPYIKESGTYRVPVFTCATKEGKQFNVTAMGNMEEKHHFFTIADTLIGKKLTVKYFNLTMDGVPNLPVALRLRDDL